MIVVEMNAIAYLFLPGEHTENARSVVLRDPEWCADLWRCEFRNVLALYIRKKAISIATAFSIAH